MKRLNSEIFEYEGVCIEEGKFVKEDKYRFQCWVDINGEVLRCYLPANCKLERFISLKDKKVILSRYSGKNDKFRYKVEAVRYKNTTILLNLNYLNTIVEREIKRKIFDFLGERTNVIKEKIVHGYKSDLYIADTETLIEIKSVLTLKESVVYPQAYSEHMLKQLNVLKRIAEEGKEVYYFIVGLSPSIKEIIIDSTYEKYGILLNECQHAGVKIKAFSLRYYRGKYRIKEEIKIILKKEKPTVFE